MIGLFPRELNDKGRPFSRSTSGRDASPVALDDLLAYGKPHTGPFILTASAVKSLKGGKDPLEVLLVKADAIVLNDNLKAFIIHYGAPHFDKGLFAFLVKLECIADKILKKLAHLSGIGFNDRKVTDIHLPSCRFDPNVQVQENFTDEGRKLDIFQGRISGSHSRIVQEGLEKRLHALCCMEHPVQVFFSLFSKRATAFLFEYIPEREVKGISSSNITIEGLKGEARLLGVSYFKENKDSFNLKDWGQRFFENFGFVGDLTIETIRNFELIKTQENVHLGGMYIYFLKKDFRIFVFTGGSEDFIRKIIINGKW